MENVLLPNEGGCIQGRLLNLCRDPEQWHLYCTYVSDTISSLYQVTRIRLLADILTPLLSLYTLIKLEAPGGYLYVSVICVPMNNGKYST